MSGAQASADATAESLNGFDEIAIEKHFNGDFYELKEKPLMFLRALAFVDMRRTGAKDRDAYKASMELTVKEIGNYFPDEPAEVDPDEPVTDEGKGDEPSG